MSPRTDFERAAAASRGSNAGAELWRLIWHHKRWWLVPIVFVLLATGVLAALATTGAAPFIYSLF
jgi:hypothetical protein